MLLLTAVISAIVSTAVAFAVASARVGREERGKRAHAARLAVADAVADRLADVLEFSFGIRESMRREPDTGINTDDMVWAGGVLVASSGLTWWRRALVRYRLRKLIGRALFEFAEVRPVTDPRHALTIVMTREYQNRKQQRYAPEDFHGLFDEALTAPAGDPKLDRLIKQLKRLKAAR